MSPVLLGASQTSLKIIWLSFCGGSSPFDLLPSPQVLALVFVRKVMDLCFSKRELSWLDDLMPESKKKKLDDAKKKKEEEEVVWSRSLQRGERARAGRVGGWQPGTLRATLRAAFLQEDPTWRVCKTIISERFGSASVADSAMAGSTHTAPRCPQQLAPCHLHSGL